MTTLSVLIPTQGRDTLKRAVLSAIGAGLGEDDELIIVADTFEVAKPEALHKSILRMVSGSPIGHIRYLELDDGHHCYGHCQLNHGLEQASGRYIHCQDDDDIYTDGSIARIKRFADGLPEPVPMLFRFKSWFGPTFWDHPGLVAENHIGGHCAVFPNDEKLGRFTCRYQGDFDYIRSTLDNYPPDTAVWVDDVICRARPAEVLA